MEFWICTQVCRLATIEPINLNNYRPQRSCEGYVFTSVCLPTGGECLTRYPPWRPPGRRPPPRWRPPGMENPLLGWRTPPWDGEPPLDGEPPPMENPPWDGEPPPWDGELPLGWRNPPPEIRPLLRTVRILLECILVITILNLQRVHMETGKLTVPPQNPENVTRKMSHKLAAKNVPVLSKHTYQKVSQST